MTADATPEDQNQRVARFWDESHGREAADALLEHPIIQTYIALRGFGELRGHLDVAIDRIKERTLPGARILSVGCGAALKERSLACRLPDRRFIGIDIAESTLAQARADIAAAGITNLELRRGDFNALDLPPQSFDLVLGLGAIHHIANLEQFWHQCRQALTPGGCVLAQEYVGPSRFQWTAAQIEIGNWALRELIPAQHQTHHRSVEPVPLAALLGADPSEAVRSAEILSTCKAAGYTVSEYRGGGCGLVQPVLWDQAHTFDPRNWDHNAVLFALFREEDRWTREGVLPDCYAMFVAEV